MRGIKSNPCVDYAAKLKIGIIIYMLLIIVLQMPLLEAAQERSLVGALVYPVWVGDEWAGLCDEITLTPPKYAHLLPFYAEVTYDSSRLSRTTNTPEEFVYRLDYDSSSIIIYAAFNDAEARNPSNDIGIYTSSDNTVYTLFQPQINTIKYAIKWQKVTLWGPLPGGIRYIKIKINKTDGTASNPQIMRVDIMSTENSSVQSKRVFVDEMNDLNRMYSHTSNLALATDNAAKFRLVTGLKYTQEEAQKQVDEQIFYAKGAHIDYFAVLNRT